MSAQAGTPPFGAGAEMRVRDHRLYEIGGASVPFVATPNQGGEIEPTYLVIHYTATLTLEAAAGWFRNPAANASAHIIVGRDGTVVQMVPFDRCAWHAGRSRWAGLEGLNAHSIGIELVNAGALDRAPGGMWADWVGNRLSADDVIVARHRHESCDRGWQAFEAIQVQRALTIATALHRRYRFRNVLGHDDIAPGRKIDPGPAFPMTRFAADVFADEPTAATAGVPVAGTPHVVRRNPW